MNRKKLLITISHLLAIIMLFSVLGFTQGTAQLIATGTLTKLGDNSYQATVSVRNTGTGTAQNVVLGSASLGAAVGTAVPQSIGSIPPGGMASATINFAATAGNSGAMVAERFA